LQKQSQISKLGMPTKNDLAIARQLFMKFCAEKNVAFNVTSSVYLQAYVAFVSGCRYKAPTTHYLVQALDQIRTVIDAKMRKILHDSSFLAVCADSWTHAGKHVTAVTGGPLSASLFLSSFESNEPETADLVAKEIHKCILESMGLNTGLSNNNEAYPVRKVSVFTTDTTNLMPATARVLSSMLMCQGLVWVPCFSHCANLLLLDQLEVGCFAELLAHSRQITSLFRNSNNFRKLFLSCVPLVSARIDPAS
jgi:hypothetical protein